MNERKNTKYQDISLQNLRKQKGVYKVSGERRDYWKRNTTSRIMRNKYNE